MGDNFNLKAAAARVKAAHAQVRISGAHGKLNLSSSLEASRQHRENPTATTSRFNAGLNASWEADLWGRLSHRSLALSESTLAQKSDLDNARLSLAAQMARNWFQGIEASLQLDLTSTKVASFNHTLGIISERYHRGIGDALEVRLARENLASAKVGLHRQSRLRDSFIRSLETLAGAHPSANMMLPSLLPRLSTPVPAGIPAELINRRPDLISAHHRLRSSIETDLEAGKNLLPNLSFSANGGNISEDFRSLLNWEDLFWTLAANIGQPLFQGGRLKAEQTLARAGYEEALAHYTQAVLTAFQEVETALAAVPLLQQQWHAQKKATEESQASAALALERYRAGLTGITTLLDAQRRTFNAQSALLNVSLLKLLNRIDLNLALGGDFQQLRPKTP